MMLDYFKKTPHRNHLEFYLNRFLPNLNGSILDIGSKNRRYDYLMKEKPHSIDLVENVEFDVMKGDVNNLDFPDGKFNNVICLEVLEYVKTPPKAISEIYRVLSVDGTAIISVPFMYKFHEDYLRISEKYIREKFSDFSEIDVYSMGCSYSIVLDIVFSKIKRIKFRLFRYIFTILYLPFTILLNKKIKRGGDFVSGYFIVVKK